jgi:hypothetical protein
MTSTTKLVSFYSGDRDVSAWPGCNEYAVSIPSTQHVTSVKLASFEMTSSTDAPILGDRDTLHIHEGCIIGSAPQSTDDGILYENQLVVTCTHSGAISGNAGVISGNAGVISGNAGASSRATVTIPSYSNKCSYTRSSEDDEVLVTCDAPHGLYAGVSANVILIHAPFPDDDIVEIASTIGGLDADVEIVDDVSFTIKHAFSAEDDPANLPSRGILHAEEPSFKALADQINKVARRSNVDLRVAYSDGVFNFIVAHGRPCESVSLTCTGGGPSLFEGNNPRGIGFSLGLCTSVVSTATAPVVSKILKSQRNDGRHWALTPDERPLGHISVHVDMDPRATQGDVVALTSVLSRALTYKLNVYNGGIGTDFPFQINVVGETGEMSPVSLSIGRCGVRAMGERIGSMLASTVGGTWLCEHDVQKHVWSFRSSKKFSFHFDDVECFRAAEYFGFDPHGVYYSDGDNTIVSSSPRNDVQMHSAFPRYSTLNDAVSEHEENQFEVRELRHEYNVRSLEDGRFVMRATRPASMVCSITSGVYNDADGLYTVTAEGSRPVYFQAGQFVHVSKPWVLATAMPKESVCCEVVSVGHGSSSMKLRVHGKLLKTIFGDDEGVVNFPVQCVVYLIARPKFSILGRGAPRSIHEFLGIGSDVDALEVSSVHTGRFDESVIELSPGLLVCIDANGGARQPLREETIVTRGGNTTSCLVRIPSKANRLVHVNTIGLQEIPMGDAHVNSVRVSLKDDRGRLSQKCGDHMITLLITYKIG